MRACLAAALAFVLCNCVVKRLKLSVTVQVVSGRAIEVPQPAVKGAPVSDELIDQYLNMYTDALVELYNTHRHKYGSTHRPLVVT